MPSLPGGPSARSGQDGEPKGAATKPPAPALKLPKGSAPAQPVKPGGAALAEKAAAAGPANTAGAALAAGSTAPTGSSLATEGGSGGKAATQAHQAVQPNSGSRARSTPEKGLGAPAASSTIQVDDGTGHMVPYVPNGPRVDHTAKEPGDAVVGFDKDGKPVTHDQAMQQVDDQHARNLAARLNQPAPTKPAPPKPPTKVGTGVMSYQDPETGETIVRQPKGGKPDPKGPIVGYDPTTLEGKREGDPGPIVYGKPPVPTKPVPPRPGKTLGKPPTAKGGPQPPAKDAKPAASGKDGKSDSSGDPGAKGGGNPPPAGGQPSGPTAATDQPVGQPVVKVDKAKGHLRPVWTGGQWHVFFAGADVECRLDPSGYQPGGGYEGPVYGADGSYLGEVSLPGTQPAGGGAPSGSGAGTGGNNGGGGGGTGPGGGGGGGTGGPAGPTASTPEVPQIPKPPKGLRPGGWWDPIPGGGRPAPPRLPKPGSPTGQPAPSTPAGTNGSGPKANGGGSGGDAGGGPNAGTGPSVSSGPSDEGLPMERDRDGTYHPAGWVKGADGRYHSPAGARPVGGGTPTPPTPPGPAGGPTPPMQFGVGVSMSSGGLRTDDPSGQIPPRGFVWGPDGFLHFDPKRTGGNGGRVPFDGFSMTPDGQLKADHYDPNHPENGPIPPNGFTIGPDGTLRVAPDGAGQPPAASPSGGSGATSSAPASGPTGPVSPGGAAVVGGGTVAAGAGAMSPQPPRPPQPPSQPAASGGGGSTVIQGQPVSPAPAFGTNPAPANAPPGAGAAAPNGAPGAGPSEGSPGPGAGAVEPAPSPATGGNGPSSAPTGSPAAPRAPVPPRAPGDDRNLGTRPADLQAHDEASHEELHEQIADDRATVETARQAGVNVDEIAQKNGLDLRKPLDTQAEALDKTAAEALAKMADGRVVRANDPDLLLIMKAWIQEQAALRNPAERDTPGYRDVQGQLRARLADPAFRQKLDGVVQVRDEGSVLQPVVNAEQRQLIQQMAGDRPGLGAAGAVVDHPDVRSAFAAATRVEDCNDAATLVANSAAKVPGTKAGLLPASTRLINAAQDHDIAVVMASDGSKVYVDAAAQYWQRMFKDNPRLVQRFERALPGITDRLKAGTVLSEAEFQVLYGSGPGAGLELNLGGAGAARPATTGESPAAGAAAAESSAAGEGTAGAAAAVGEEASAGARAVGAIGKGLKAVGAGAAVAGSAVAGYQIGTGIDKMAHGQTADGGVDVLEGGANLTLSTGGFGTAVAETGAAAAGVTLLAGAAAAGSVALAGETARAAIKGEKTPLEVADDYYGTHFSDIVGWVTGRYSTPSPAPAPAAPTASPPLQTNEVLDPATGSIWVKEADGHSHPKGWVKNAAGQWSAPGAQ